MLSDRRREVEKWAARRRERRGLALAYGQFIAELAPWDWFINPISFRDDWRKAHRHPGLLNMYQRPLFTGMRARKKTARYGELLSPPTGPPCPDEGLHYITAFFGDVQKQSGLPIGWMVAEEFGRLGGRYHCHALMVGVSGLRREFWWHEAFRRFGRTRIEPFDPRRGAAFYAAKYAGKALGALHFGGTWREWIFPCVEQRAARLAGKM